MMKLSKGQSYLKQNDEKTEKEEKINTSNLERPNPRTILLQRDDGEFGFTLRHFIVYPPTNLQATQSKNQVNTETPWQKDRIEPMDTIFVREVKEGSPAHQAGLVTGDRIITINGEPLAGKTYAEVIDLIYKSGSSLQMLVVPKEDDILQLYFASSAYQPVEREPKSSTHPQLHFSPWSSVTDQENSESQSLLTQDAQESNIIKNQNVNDGNIETVGKVEKSDETTCQQPTDNVTPVSEQKIENWEVPDLEKLQLKNVFCCRESISLPDSSHEDADRKNLRDQTLQNWEGSCKSVDVIGSQTSLSTYSSAVRPHRFHDTLSKLLYDMWYHPDPTKHDSNLQLETSLDSQKEYLSDTLESDEKRDHKSGGIATLISRTMKALVAHPSEFKLFSSETQSSLNTRKANSDSKVNFVSSNDSSEKLVPTTSAEILYSSHSSVNTSHKAAKGRYQKVKPHVYHKTLKINNNHSFDSINSLDKNKQPENYMEDSVDSDNISSLHLVAQRLHLFESGHLAAKSVERTKLYQSELARMSEQSQTPIVSVRAAHFEQLSPTFKRSNIKNLSSKEKHVNHVDLQPSSLPIFSSVQDKNIVPSVSTVTTTSTVSTRTTTATNSIKSPTTPSGVVHRRKTIPSGDRDDHHIVRRISYLRATARDRIHIDSDISDDDVAAESSGTPTEHRIKKLKAFFGEKTPKIKQAIDPPCTEEKEENPFLYQGWLICKIVNLEGKRASDRSWRPVWAVLQKEALYLLKDKKDISQVPLEEDEQTIDLKSVVVSIAHDYTKRKHVLRLQLPNKTEYLFQAENHSSMIKWLCVLQAICSNDDKKFNWNSYTSVLERAAAYEQQIQNNKGRISPLTLTKPGKKMPFRHRSPSGHSPATKARRASHGDELALPKLGMMWRDRVAHGWKKVQNVSSVPLKGSSFGMKLEDCPPGEANEYVPWLIETCIKIVESKGLDVVGIYRVPGNSAAVSMLMDAVNQGIDKINLDDYRWKDVNVVSSLLKAFFRKLPEPLLTSHLYSKFIAASKLEDPVRKLAMFKTLASQLPPSHLETLKLLMKHLQKVVSHSNVNKMEARNLAIVFGPTLVRSAENTMMTMVTDMSHQCYIIETMITYADWLFGDKSMEKLPNELKLIDKGQTPPLILHNALLSNIHKIDGTHPGTDEELSNIMGSTRQRWLKNKGNISKSVKEEKIEVNGDSKGDVKYSEEASSINSYNGCSNSASVYCKYKSYSSNVPKDDSKQHSSRDWPLSSFEQHISPETNEENLSDEVVHSYDELSAITQERIKNFEMETRALLQRDNQWPKQSFTSNKVEWEQIEREWQKAKIEMEQDDILDHLADDPSNYITMLNGTDEENSHLPTDGSYNCELERIRSNLDKRLQLSNECSTTLKKLQFSDTNNQLQSNLQKSSYEDLSFKQDSSLTDKLQTNKFINEQKPKSVFMHKKSSSLNEETKNTQDHAIGSTGYNHTLPNNLNFQNKSHRWDGRKQQQYVITATVSPSDQTVSTSTSIPVIRATVTTSNHQTTPQQTRKTDWNLPTTQSESTLPPQLGFLRRRHTIAGPKIISQYTCLSHPEMVRSSEDVMNHS